VIVKSTLEKNTLGFKKKLLFTEEIYILQTFEAKYVVMSM
jgi:hypothetical protein